MLVIFHFDLNVKDGLIPMFWLCPFVTAAEFIFDLVGRTQPFWKILSSENTVNDFSSVIYLMLDRVLADVRADVRARVRVDTRLHSDRRTLQPEHGSGGGGVVPRPTPHSHPDRDHGQHRHHPLPGRRGTDLPHHWGAFKYFQTSYTILVILC